MEKRRYRRKRLRIPITLDPGTLNSGTGDISSQGVYVRSARVLTPGTSVSLAVLVPAGPAWAQGVVRWARRVPPELLPHTKGGMGIQFTSCSPELVAYLRELFEAEATPAKS